MKEESVRYIAIGKPKNTHLGGEPVEEFRRAIGVRKEGKPRESRSGPSQRHGSH